LSLRAQVPSGPVTGERSQASDPIVRLQQLVDLRKHGAPPEAEFTTPKLLSAN
jgi:hypothetical protein